MEITCRRIPLFNLSGYKFQRSIFGGPMFKVTIYGGSFGGLSELRNLTA